LRRGLFVFLGEANWEEQLIETAPNTERPDEKVLLVWRVSNGISYAVFFAIVFIASVAFWFFSKTPWYWMVVPSLIVLVLWGLSGAILRKQWENWTFSVTPEALEMSHGWLWRNRRVVARDRIQHVDINSGPFDRRFGLVQVVVHTAGTNVGMIPGLRPERANLLRDQLLEGRAVE
jgi:membrane protein YdbS with pleckstrin-like domain